jgi:hypothetical protein
LLFNSADTGTTNVGNDIDDGFVLGPDGKGLSIDGEEAVLGLNYLSSSCVVAGTINAIG